MIAFVEDQLALPLICRHCAAPIALQAGLCPMCGHRAGAPLAECDCLTCYQTRLAKEQRPRWISPPRPSS